MSPRNILLIGGPQAGRWMSILTPAKQIVVAATVSGQFVYNIAALHDGEGYVEIGVPEGWTGQQALSELMNGYAVGAKL